MDSPAHAGHSSKSTAVVSDHLPDGPTIFFVAARDSTAGPYTAAELQARLANGALTPENLVCLPGWREWRRVADVPELAGLNPVSAADSAPPTLPSSTASAGQNSTQATGLHGLRQPLLAPQAVAGPITPKNPLLPAWSAVRSLVLRCHAGLRLPRWVELGILTTVGAVLVLVVVLQAVRLKNSSDLTRAREATEANARAARIAEAKAAAEKLAREQAENQARIARIRADTEAKAEAELKTIAEVRARAGEGDRAAQVQLAKLLDCQASTAALLTRSDLSDGWRYSYQLEALNMRATNASANSANNFFRGKRWHDHPLPAEALDMYRRAAEQGSAEAQVALGDAFGRFTKLNHAAHPIILVAVPAFAADTLSYGFCFADQQEESARLAGVPRNESEAFKWYYRAAQQGDPYAQGQVAAAYLNGKGGVIRSEMEACKWDILSGELSGEEMLGFVTLSPAQKAAVISWVRAFKPTGPDVELVAANRVKVFAERRARKQAEEKQQNMETLARMNAASPTYSDYRKVMDAAVDLFHPNASPAEKSKAADEAARELLRNGGRLPPPR